MIWGMILFFTGAGQVFCITVQTWFIANYYPLGVAVFGFLISFIWSFNVKRIAMNGLKERIYYSCGASAGALLGLYTGKLILC